MAEFNEKGSSPAVGNGLEQKTSVLDKTIKDEDFTWKKPSSDDSDASVRKHYWTLPGEMDRLREVKAMALTAEQQDQLAQYEDLIAQRLQLLDEWRELDQQIRGKEEEVDYLNTLNAWVRAYNGIRRQAPEAEIYDEYPVDPESGKLMSFEATEAALRTQAKKYDGEGPEVDQRVNQRIDAYRRVYPSFEQNRAVFEDYARVKKELQPLLQQRKEFDRRASNLQYDSDRKWDEMFPSEKRLPRVG
jgi:hypothetical protein